MMGNLAPESCWALALQFTRLRLLGFKSFVDPTELVISPGLTGVVGPNGCGKSNLLEALRWVMGENRAKSMRGDGMEDVIFAGSNNRPQRNHAEVTLTLDNRSRLAPAQFNTSDTLEVVRRITRDAGSAYRTNGKEARARDVQMLFADASTGAHSPALVGQGRISELINAKPKARRRVLEEAAGISGLYQRRHEAELKLRATEANLGRVGDVLEALESQLSSLARQARQAARYREIAANLRRSESMLIWRLWRDADEERAEAAAKLIEASKQLAAAQSQAASATRARDEAEARLPGVRDEDAIAGAVLQKVTIERDRLKQEAGEVARQIAELRSAISQIESDREREGSLNTDAVEMVEQLLKESKSLQEAGAGHAEALSEARIRADRAAENLKAAEREYDEETEASARLVAEHQMANRNLEAAKRRGGEVEAALTRAGDALAQVEKELREGEASLAQAVEARDVSAERAQEAETRLASAEEASAAARQSETDLRSELSNISGNLRALDSEASGLERLLKSGSGGSDQVLDRIEVKAGYETALGAALADDLSMPVLGEEAAGSGWRSLAPLGNAPGLPDGAEAMTGFLTAPDALARRLAAIGVVDAADGARLQKQLGPGQRLVSLEGDLWRWDGFSVEAGKAPSAAALRLQQQNRMREIRAQRVEISGRKEELETQVAEASAAGMKAAEAEKAARAERKQADQAAADAVRALNRTESQIEALKSRLGTLQSARSRAATELEECRTEISEAEAAARALDDPGAAREAVVQKKMGVESARITMLTHRTEADELDRAGKVRERRLNEITREIDGWNRRQANATTRLSDLDRRERESRKALEGAQVRPDELKRKIAELDASHEENAVRRQKAADALAAAETELRELTAAARVAESDLSSAREARARIEALSEAAQARVTAASERLESETGATPAELLAKLVVSAEDIPGYEDIENDVNRLKRQRDSLGAVNLRAEEDAREVQSEFETLAVERGDLEAAIGKLREGIANLNKEGRERLLEAFDEVNRNFSMLFRHLFGGGEASLALIESEDPLDAGLEIMCQPPGKKLSTLSLLSGGEQTLTALSLIFAVFLANPSPICVLDEVDAPLDDANVNRFCDLLDEMTKRTNTRFLIITHHAVTMARMDRLFGVTMAEQGVSQLVSVDLAAAERIVENVA